MLCLGSGAAAIGVSSLVSNEVSCSRSKWSAVCVRSLCEAVGLALCGDPPVAVQAASARHSAAAALARTHPL